MKTTNKMTKSLISKLKNTGKKAIIGGAIALASFLPMKNASAQYQNITEGYTQERVVNIEDIQGCAKPAYNWNLLNPFIQP